MIKCNHQFSVNTPAGPEQVTLKQILMSIKSQSNYRSPFFTGVDVQDDGTVLILYHSIMKEEAETTVPHLLVYLEAFFGSDIYQLFTPEHRQKMS